MKSNKSRIFFREIAFLAVLNIFPVEKLIFGHFWNGKKMEFGQKNFVKLNYLIARVFWPGLFFKFSGPASAIFLAEDSTHCNFLQLLYLWPDEQCHVDQIPRNFHLHSRIQMIKFSCTINLKKKFYMHIAKECCIFFFKMHYFFSTFSLWVWIFLASKFYIKFYASSL